MSVTLLYKQYDPKSEPKPRTTYKKLVASLESCGLKKSDNITLLHGYDNIYNRPFDEHDESCLYMVRELDKKIYVIKFKFYQNGEIKSTSFIFIDGGFSNGLCYEHIHGFDTKNQDFVKPIIDGLDTLYKNSVLIFIENFSKMLLEVYAKHGLIADKPSS